MTGPITIESFNAAAKKAMEAPHRPERIRFVSGERYQTAKKALDEGATPEEVEWVLRGLSLEEARKTVGGRR